MNVTRSLWLSLLLLTGCQSDGNQAEQLETEVMAIHDEVMPRMDELMDLKSQISTRLTNMDSLTKAGQAPARLDTLRREGLAINQALTEADSLMMDWMNQYKPDTLKVLDEAGAQTYLSREKEKINGVKEKFTASIDRARKYLQRNP